MVKRTSSHAVFVNTGDRGSQITLVGLFSNIGLTATKGLAGWYLHSASLMADAGHSLSGEFHPFQTITAVKAFLKIYSATLSLFSAGSSLGNHPQNDTRMALPNSRRLARPQYPYSSLAAHSESASIHTTFSLKLSQTPHRICNPALFKTCCASSQRASLYPISDTDMHTHTVSIPTLLGLLRSAFLPRSGCTG